METLFVSTDTTHMYASATEDKVIGNLLWGDRARIQIGQPEINGRIKVAARGKKGYVAKNSLGTQALLEIYFIDVGQGDGVLIVTPEGKHIMIDGGYKRSAQPTGKNAADFIDWKFFKDYGMDEILIDDMIASHNDADHYGGLWDLLNPNEQAELDIPAENVHVTNFYHAGVSWFKNQQGVRTLGPKEGGFLTLLLEDKTDIGQKLNPNPSQHVLQGDWGDFLSDLVKKAANCQRISHKTGFLPGYEPGTGAISLKVLGPIESTKNGKAALKSFGKDSLNTNGHSILLRIDYKNARFLLTGDLNTKSQEFILKAFEGNEKELACDVVKSCHHGSDDCSFAFLTHLNAGATIISSGDSEGHGHPRPAIVAASGLTGFKQLKDDKLITPLIYSTEISRSYRIGSPESLTISSQPPQTINAGTPVQVAYSEVAAGDIKPRKAKREFWKGKLVTGTIYGLVNVRTDGNKILCATLAEKDAGWDIRTFNSRFLV